MCPFTVLIFYLMHTSFSLEPRLSTWSRSELKVRKVMRVLLQTSRKCLKKRWSTKQCALKLFNVTSMVPRPLVVKKVVRKFDETKEFEFVSIPQEDTGSCRNGIHMDHNLWSNSPIYIYIICSESCTHCLKLIPLNGWNIDNKLD